MPTICVSTDSLETEPQTKAYMLTLNFEEVEVSCAILGKQKWGGSESKVEKEGEQINRAYFWAGSSSTTTLLVS